MLQLPEDQSGYVASILSRRARLLGLMWDLDKTPLRRRESFKDPRPPLGCVGPWPRPSQGQELKGPVVPGFRALLLAGSSLRAGATPAGGAGGAGCRPQRDPVMP